ncbi:MAG TPA: hypothetical protein VGB52_08460 [Actinomycetota bacterium]
MKWKRWWPDLPEDMPLDVLPASNGEFVPPPATREQRAVMALQNEGIEYWRQKFNMSRRDFVRTAAAMAIGFWALETVQGTRRAGADGTATTNACDLEFDGLLETDDFWLGNKPGEFVFDVQSHHVESDGMWRVTNPGFEAFFAGVWTQAGPLGGTPSRREDGSIRGFGAGEIDPIENLSRYHYLKELFLDSATTMTVLSAVPAAPDITQPLPIDRAVLTAKMVNELSGSQRTVLHAFVMPNRGSAGSTASALNSEPIYMQREFEIMEQRAAAFQGLIRGWKTYPAWGDVPYSTGWFFDDELVGQRFIDHVAYCALEYGVPPNIATHKGFALPAFDQRAASPRDIGPAARRNPGVNFIVYHSGFDGESMTAYPGDANVNSADRRVDSLIKSLRENSWDATAFGARPFDAENPTWANVPNVYAEIGSTWRSVMGQLGNSNWDGNGSNAAAHLLGKLISYVGPKRICWGTDSLWFGSPQSEIVGLRRVRYDQTPEIWDAYNLPYAIDGDAAAPQENTASGSTYTLAKKVALGIEDWPTDGVAHPERSIRNWIFGYAAATVYRVDELPAPRPAPAGQVMECDDVQKIRDGYVLNQMTPKEQVPLASNQVIGPRTPAELFKQRSEGPWAP